MCQREFDIILSYILMVCNPIAMILLFWLMIFYRLKVQRVEQKSSKRVFKKSLHPWWEYEEETSYRGGD